MITEPKTERLRFRITASDRALLESVPMPMASTVSIGILLISTGNTAAPTDGAKSVQAEMRIAGKLKDRLNLIAADRGISKAEAVRLAIATAVHLYHLTHQEPVNAA